MTSALNPHRFHIFLDIEEVLGHNFIRSRVLPRLTSMGECIACGQLLGNAGPLTVISTSTVERAHVRGQFTLLSAHRADASGGEQGFVGNSLVEVHRPSTYRCVPAELTPSTTAENCC